MQEIRWSVSPSVVQRTKSVQYSAFGLIPWS